MKYIATLLLSNLLAITCMANVNLTSGQMSGRSTKGLYGKVKTADYGKPDNVTTETKEYIETCILTCFEDAATSPNQTSPIEVTAPEIVGTKEQFKLTFTFQSKPQDTKLIPSDNFEILMGPSTSNTTTITAGIITTTFAVSYILKPKRNGKFPIPKLTAQINGQSVTSKPFYITVTANKAVSNNKPATTGTDKDSIFVKTILDKESVRKGESVLCTFKIYTLDNISSIDEVSLIDFPYCYIEEQELGDSRSYSLENIKNINYKTVIYRQFKLTPLQSGQIRIPSVRFSFILEAAYKDPFDAFFNNNSNATKVKKSVSTNPIIINVTQ